MVTSSTLTRTAPSAMRLRGKTSPKQPYYRFYAPTKSPPAAPLYPGSSPPSESRGRLDIGPGPALFPIFHGTDIGAQGAREHGAREVESLARRENLLGRDHGRGVLRPRKGREAPRSPQGNPCGRKDVPSWDILRRPQPAYGGAGFVESCRAIVSPLRVKEACLGFLWFSLARFV